LAVLGAPSNLYSGHSSIAGPAAVETGYGPTQVAFRPILSTWERTVLTGFILLNLVASAGFILWLMRPEHVPTGSLNLFGFGVLVLLEMVKAIQAATIWLWAWLMRDPIPLQPPAGLRVALLTTIVPSREPIELVGQTLAAMRHVRYSAGTVDVWILDEEDDPRVRRVAAELGVRHFSRRNRPEYNQPEGPFKARTKAGNHNAWLAENGDRYDIVAQMDPDHVPTPDFLERTLGYFRDPEVAFVVAPQVYGNLNDSFVAWGAAEQAYIFRGVVQRGANAFGAPHPVGSNHLYRVEAWRQIGGYAGSITEDLLTGITVAGTVCPATGRPWKGVYTPDILAVGEGPRTWTDYFNQQLRWAYGMWEVILRHDLKLLPRLSPGRLLHYVCLQYYYPSVGLVWLLGNLLTLLYLGFGVTFPIPDIAWWLLAGTIAGRLALFIWLRRFNLAAHERRGVGVRGMILTAVTAPIYFVAGFQALLKRRLGYVVTAKGALASQDGLRTFRVHLWWLVGLLFLLALSQLLGHTAENIRVWAWWTAGLLVVPLFISGLWRQALRLPLAASGAVVFLAAFTLAGDRPPAHDALVLLRVPADDAAAGSSWVKFGVYRDPIFGNRGYVERVQAELGVPLEVLTVFQAWGDADRDFNGPWYAEQAAKGREVIVSWEPWSRSGRPGLAFDLEEIARGQYDGYIRSWARAVAASPDQGRHLIIRFAHEMNGDWYPWAAGRETNLSSLAGRTYVQRRKAAYRLAFRHIVEVFRYEGAQSRFLFSPAWAGPGSEAEDYYPGPDVVDLVGVTVLNFGPASPWGWQEFADLFGRQYPALQKFGKPIVLPEVATVGSDAEKAAWLDGMFRALARQFPAVTAVVYFDVEVDRLNPTLNWALSKNPQALEVLRRWLANGPPPVREFWDLDPALP